MRGAGQLVSRDHGGHHLDRALATLGLKREKGSDEIDWADQGWCWRVPPTLKEEGELEDEAL